MFLSWFKLSLLLDSFVGMTYPVKLHPLAHMLKQLFQCYHQWIHLLSHSFTTQSEQWLPSSYFWYVLSTHEWTMFVRYEISAWFICEGFSSSWKMKSIIQLSVSLSSIVVASVFNFEKLLNHISELIQKACVFNQCQKRIFRCFSVKIKKQGVN